MLPFQLLDEAKVPGSDTVLRLYRRGNEFSIRADWRELMSARAHRSEEALATLACASLAGRREGCVLIGGLGMGFTLAAALKTVGPRVQVVQCELVPAVIEWNRGPLGALTGYPLSDPRVEVIEGDVADALRAHPGRYDVVLLDVDNGPVALTRGQNRRLYSRAGLRTAKAALRPSGALWIWSAGRDDRFVARLRGCGFAVREHEVAAHDGGRRGRGGPRYVLWEARAVARGAGSGAAGRTRA